MNSEVNMEYGVNLIEALLKLMQVSKIEWVLLSQQSLSHEAKRYVIEKNKYIYSTGDYPIVEEYSSFCVALFSGHVYLMKFKKSMSKKEYFILGTQAGMYNPVFEINDEYSLQDEIAELYSAINVIRNEVSNADFIERVVDFAKENEQS